ncbi:MlaD family protein [Nocardioides sp.]|uniref:MlaD family protein n=1 Tax=Nocardioides sp. TaxID=35761 RepID=UPI0032192E27
MSAARAARGRRSRLAPSSTTIGVVLLVLTLALFWALFSKDKISTALSSGETVEVHFERAYKLRPNVSEVKVAFVPVGKVTSVERDGTGAIVSLKVDEEVLDKLGSAPSATIRPTTLLGGSYFVDLQPGGDPGAWSARSIPVDRTAVPVELDRVARALQPDALAGVRSSISQTESTLAKGGDEALQRLLENAPVTLDGAARVLDSARGYRKNRDLGQVVSGLESTARVLTRNDGQLESILAGLDETAEVFGDNGPALRQTLEAMPQALDNTRSGLARLDTTLTTLRDISDDTRTVTDELDATLTELDPTLIQARTILGDARRVVRDARPVVDNLVPGGASATRVLRDVNGPVIERVNGPVMSWLYEAYDGKGPYSDTHSKKTMYEEITYTFADLTRASSLMDANGHGVGFQPGIGAGSVGGLPVSFEQLFKILTSGLYGDEPMDTIPPLSSSGNGNENPLSGLPGVSQPGGLLGSLVDGITGGGR